MLHFVPPICHHEYKARGRMGQAHAEQIIGYPDSDNQMVE